MTQIPEDLFYTKDHEWVRLMDNSRARVGITDHAQDALGDVTFVDLPQSGDSFAAGESFGAVESVKAASDLYMPLAGEVTAVNEGLEASPEQVNTDPYGEGWMIEVKLDKGSDREGLLSPEAYRELVASA